MNIRKGDTVVVIHGTHKGKTGKVLSVDTDKKVVFVQQIRLVKRHRKPGRRQTAQGGIVEKEAPISVSNVALIDPKTNKRTRVRARVAEAEDKVSARRSKMRVSVRSGVEIERPTVKS